MATTTSIASSSMQGLATCSKFCIQNQWNCQKRRKSRASTSLAFFSPLHRARHSQCVWLMGVCMKSRFLALKAIDEDDRPSEDDSEEESSSDDNSEQVDGELFRKRLENIIGDDGDAKFSGKDLAMLIRNKYGRSYDVQLIKKDFMGRKLLAMNVMWKYREQRSFPLTEEEYLLRLDDVANNLKCWGAVSYVRNSLAKTKERPRIGKAVSIFIDLDESGGRANEWIYR